MRVPLPSGPVNAAHGSVVGAGRVTPSSIARRTSAPPPSLTRVAVGLAEATVELPCGDWDPQTVARETPEAFGLLLLDGLALREVVLDGVPAAQFVIPGETVETGMGDASPLCAEHVSWSVVEPARAAVLGRRFLAASQRHPWLVVALHQRQAAQLRRAMRYAAIVHLPRVEQRVLTLMCALAEERGRVAADGITVRLDLTHERLGRLVGARRPTVSLALKALADEGLLHRRGDEWLIAHRPTHFAETVALAAA